LNEGNRGNPFQVNRSKTVGFDTFENKNNVRIYLIFSSFYHFFEIFEVWEKI